MKQMQQPARHARVIHLVGGLRAVDNCSGTIDIYIDAARKLGSFATKSYEETYAELNNFDLQPIGVEFPNSLSLSGQMPADWQFFTLLNGFELMKERRAWSDIRNAASKEGKYTTFDYAARAISYMDLLTIRVSQLSNAYSQMIAGNLELKPNQFFSNLSLPYVDAAIHGFLADAACLRDFIAEITWELILKGSPKLTTLGTFIKKAKTVNHPIAKEILTAADEGGWIKIFSNLRDQVIHVAPLSARSRLHMCEIREIDKGGLHAPILHYPLLTIGDGSLWDFGKVDFRSLESISSSLHEYRKFSNESHDALKYACDTTSRFVALLRQIRIEAKLSAEGIVFTDDDVIGEIKVKYV